MPEMPEDKINMRYIFFAIILLSTFYFLLYNIAVFALESGQVPGEAVTSGENSAVSGNTVSVNLACEKFSYPWCDSAEAGISGLVGRFYQIALAFVGVTAFAVIIFAGITYTLSAGNSSKQKDSIDWITSAGLGIVLLLGAYLLLYTINPELVKLREPSIEPLPEIYSQISTPAAPYDTPSEILASRTECSGCVPLSGINFALKYEACEGGPNNCRLPQQMIDKLNSLVSEAEDIGLYAGDWRVTEAWPPTVAHLDRCHNYGTCVDIALMPGGVTKNNVDKFIKAAQNAGFNVTNEYVNYGGTQFVTTKGDHLHIEL